MMRCTRKEWVKQFVKDGPSKEERFLCLMQNVEDDVKSGQTQIYSSQELLELLQAILDGEKRVGE